MSCVEGKREEEREDGAQEVDLLLSQLRVHLLMIQARFGFQTSGRTLYEERTRRLGGESSGPVASGGFEGLFVGLVLVRNLGDEGIIGVGIREQ